MRRDLYCGTFIFLKKWDNPGLFFVYFQSFLTTIQFLQQINVKNVQISIHDTVPGFSPRPSEHESSPITTIPGHPPLWDIHFTFNTILGIRESTVPLIAIFPRQQNILSSSGRGSFVSLIGQN